MPIRECWTSDRVARKRRAASMSCTIDRVVGALSAAAAVTRTRRAREDRSPARRSRRRPGATPASSQSRRERPQHVNEDDGRGRAKGRLVPRRRDRDSVIGRGTRRAGRAEPRAMSASSAAVSAASAHNSVGRRDARSQRPSSATMSRTARSMPDQRPRATRCCGRCSARRSRRIAAIGMTLT